MMDLAGVVVIFINIPPGGLLEVLYEKETVESREERKYLTRGGQIQGAMES